MTVLTTTAYIDDDFFQRDGDSSMSVKGPVLPGTLGNWVNKYRKENAVEDVEEPLSVSDRVRLSELESEVRRLRMENDFLKKAAAFFARQQD